MFKIYTDEKLQSTINELFRDVFSETFKSPIFNSDVRYEVIEKTDSYLIEMLLPGYKKENIKIDLNDSVLKVSYESSEEDKYSKYIKAFSKSFRISADLSQEDITAKMEDGVLKISVPKLKEEVKESRTIEIQ